MDFKSTKYSQKNKEELPPINKPTYSASSQIIKSYKELNKPIELGDKVDPLILVAQYEREINRIKSNHNQMLEELHRELEILRSKNRDLLDELIVMNGGNYCCKHLDTLRHDILKSEASDNQKPLSDILNNAKINQIPTEDNTNNKSCNYKRELPELITVGNKFNSMITENKSNVRLQNQLNECNKLIDILQQENVQQKAELKSLNSLLNKGLKIAGIGLNHGLVRKNLKSSQKLLSPLSQPNVSYMDMVSSGENLRSVSKSE